MHDTALKLGRLFFEHYATAGATIVDIGSFDVNGSLRSVAPPQTFYLGIDCEHGKGVDLAVPVGTTLPIRNDFAGIVVSSSQAEHDDFFWETFLDMCRITKPEGFIYLNVPSNGSFHRYPQDCWRFYPDSGAVLAKWARKNKQNVYLVESFIAYREKDQWNDFVAVFKKGEIAADTPLISDKIPHMNSRTFRDDKVGNLVATSEDMKIIAELRKRVAESDKRVAELEKQLQAAQMPKVLEATTESSNKTDVAQPVEPASAS
ncbi:methyltransferase type 11 [Methylocella sp. CPCC 101449]|uniref:methyltransferase type 11 n=1 Tax=Methylocella sp. CPCC 101449 TaxID=2987531 RepID=UPI0028900A85|nr:methyltransferase type 11 [Methylocella sp. CPCC 101449]MDT2022609.1 methyltransferase type 11 [Methylocella sp. CPCC 101449]